MNLYKIQSIEKHGWDTVRGFVIAAPDFITARKIACQNKGGESRTVWSNGTKSTCVCIAESTNITEASVVLRDFLAG